MDGLSANPRVKAVSFKNEVVETSIGGTQTVAKMKDPPLPLSDKNQYGDKNVEDIMCKTASDQDQHQDHGKHSLSDVAEETTLDIENKENVETLVSDGQNKNQPKFLSKDEAVFVSPAVPPARTAQLVRDFDKFTPTKSRTDTLRRTTQDCLDQVSTTFVTPPQYHLRRHTLETEIFGTPDCFHVVQLETPGKLLQADDFSTDLEEESGENSCSITVAVRVRPYSQRELSDPNVKRVVSMNGNETTVTTDNGSIQRFAFDFSFWSFDRDSGDFASQSDVYCSLAQPMLGKAFEGYNTCLFAYGQTGSGKSYSIMGHGTDTGIIPRFCEELFTRAVKASNKDKVKISVEISFFEIYNEKIHDLLASKKNGKKITLRVREHPVLGPYVEGLSTFVVNSFEDVEGWITLGTKNRATAATGMNDKSSRSHSVFTLVLTQTRTERVDIQDHNHSITSKINLVDLAGSERQSQALTSGERLREGANINKSLLTLGKVISLLSERSVASKKRNVFIPYRDSVLTWLLKESLGGNSKTTMIATISPSVHHIEETLSTLRYARQTRSIVNVVRVNEDPKAKIIRELRAEIDKLRRQSGTMNDGAQLAGMAEIAMLREKLQSKEREMEELSRSWQERLRQAEARKQEESKQLEKSGVAVVKVDNQMPNLVNLNEDPQLSELLLYVIKGGQTKVGRKCPTSSHDIQLGGALIADHHCIIYNEESIVTITPIGDAQTYVNGSLIADPTILHHGDCVILGGDHYFRFNHPMEVKKEKKGKKSVSMETKDFEFAKQELIRVQDAKLQAELEEAQRAAEARMEEELGRARREAEQVLNQQRSGYEDKLANLQKTLKEQSLEVQMAKRSKQEAHSVIADLRKEKMMLEQEVLRGRQRQELEADAAKRLVSVELSSHKLRILELLEAEQAKATLRLEEALKKRADVGSPSKRRRQALGGGASNVGLRKDLYKVALLLLEANKISQHLKKGLVFSREDVDRENAVSEPGNWTQIRVTNTHHRIFTIWTVAKLEEKVIQMRDIFQNEEEHSAADDEVFNDPDDAWEKEIPTPNSSPVVNSLFKSPLSSVSSRGSQMNSSLTTTPTTRRMSFGLSSSVQDPTSCVYRACRKLLSSSLEQLNVPSYEDSMADKVLLDCELMKSCISDILGSALPASTDGHTPITCLLQLVSSAQHLASHCLAWASTIDREAPLFCDLWSALIEHVKMVTIQSSHLLQGYETKQLSLVQESSKKLSEEILNVCCTCGQLALATKTRMVRLEQFSQDSTSQPTSELCQAFLSGCDTMLDSTLKSGLKTLEKCETRAQSFLNSTGEPKELSSMCRDVKHTVLCTKVLLQACQEVQLEIGISVADGRESLSSIASDNSLFFCSSYHRSQALLNHIPSLAETAHLLVECAEPVVKGDSRDVGRLQHFAELINRHTQQLLSCSTTTDTSSLINGSIFESPSMWPPPSPSCPAALRGSRLSRADSLGRSSVQDSPCVLSDSQTEHIDSAAQEVLTSSGSLIGRLRQLTLSTPKVGAAATVSPKGVPR